MNRIIFTLLIFVGFTACTVYKEYPIDVYKPGTIAIPSDAENAAVIYRNFKYTNDTLQHYYKSNYRLRRAKNDPQNLDSIMASYCIGEMAKNLKTHNTFNEIRIFPDIFKPHKGNKLPALNIKIVEKLAASSNADILISLESFSYFFAKYPAVENVSNKTNEVITAAVWAVYNTKVNKLLERKTMIDTIYWNGYDPKGNREAKTQLPPRLMSLKIASQMAGENYAKRFFASWQTVKRMYAIPSLPDFEEADKCVQKGDWESAIRLWKRYVNDTNGKMSINARYNMALAYEMKDDLDTAEKWLDAANQLAKEYNNQEYLKMIQNYKQILEKRKKEVRKLNRM